LQAGATTQLSASATDAAGAAVNTTITWSSSDATMMSVSGSGLVSALRIGGATITASAGGKSATLTLTSSLTPFTFNQTGGSAADLQLVRDAVQFAQTYFQATFARNIQNATSVNLAGTDQGCNQPGAAAFTGAGFVTFCAQNLGWTNFGPVMKTKIAIHEVFHVLQFEVSWIKNNPTQGPAWMIEGGAEVVGFAGVSAKGMLPFETGKGCNLKEWADFNSRNPPMPPLSQMETNQAWNQVNGPRYNPAFIGMDQLVTSGGGLSSLKTYWTSVAAQTTATGWQTSFQSAFNSSTTAFYAQFPGYSAALPVPAQYACGGI
jgi:hypothetical protein